MKQKPKYDPVAHGADCARCPLNGRHTPVPPGGPSARRALLTVVGEAPGEDEIEAGAPFVGRSGAYLVRDERSLLRQMGVHPRQVHLTNSMLCRAPARDYKTYVTRLNSKYAAAKKAAARAGKPIPTAPAYPHDCCRPRLFRELRGARVVIAAGAWAARSIVGTTSITKTRGFPVKTRIDKDKVRVIPWGMAGHEHLVPSVTIAARQGGVVDVDDADENVPERDEEVIMGVVHSYYLFKSIGLKLCR